MLVLFNQLWTIEQKNPLTLPALLEAEHTSLCTNKLFLIKEEMIEESGKVDYEQLLGQWKNWVTTTMIPRLQKTKAAEKGKAKESEE